MRIFVNGTFDIIHPGHIQLLNYARGLGSQLLVAIDSDRRVSELKGHSRPVNKQQDRKFMLENLKACDRVEIFDSDQQLSDIIKMYRPNIMVKGSDYRGKPIIGAEYCESMDFFDRIDEHSTTNKIQDIINRR